MEKQQIEDQNQREELKSQAIQLRESGNPEEAIKVFENIVSWDLENENFKGAVDVYGHQRITWTHLAEREPTDSEHKGNYYLKAQEAANKGLELADEHFPNNNELHAILSMHQADLIINMVKEDLSDNPESGLSQAIELITSAIENLAGSEAHKAWALNRLAQAQHLSGDSELALETLGKGHKALMAGYNEEVKNEDDGLLKLRVWQSGLFLTQAQILIDTEKSELAKIYLQAVIGIEDPEGTLQLRKDQAQKMLDNII